MKNGQIRGLALPPPLIARAGRTEPCSAACHITGPGFAEDCRHPRQSPDKAGSAEAPPSRPCPSKGTAWHEARLDRGFGSAPGPHCFSRLEPGHEPQCKPDAEGNFIRPLPRLILRSLRSCDSTLLHSRSHRLASRPSCPRRKCLENFHFDTASHRKGWTRPRASNSIYRSWKQANARDAAPFLADRIHGYG